MYSLDSCCMLCAAITRLAWRDLLRNGDKSACEFLLSGWITQAVNADPRRLRMRILGRLATETRKRLPHPLELFR